MRVMVLAYHNMGIAGLQALERAGYEMACIFSHEDDPGENCWFGSVLEWEKNGASLWCARRRSGGQNGRRRSRTFIRR